MIRESQQKLLLLLPESGGNGVRMVSRKGAVRSARGLKNKRSKHIRRKGTPAVSRVERALERDKTEAKLDAVLMLLASGRASGAIRQVCRKTPDLEISEAEIARLIARGKRIIRSAGRVDRNEELGKALTRLNLVYRHACADREWGDARGAVRQIASLLDLRADETAQLGEDQIGRAHV